jgi:hypothetical protein
VAVAAGAVAVAVGSGQWAVGRGQWRRQWQYPIPGGQGGGGGQWWQRWRSLIGRWPPAQHSSANQRGWERGRRLGAVINVSRTPGRHGARSVRTFKFQSDFNAVHREEARL